MRLALHAALVTLIILFMAFGMVPSSAANSETDSGLLLSPNPSLDKTDGIYNVILTVNASFMPDGTLVDVNIVPTDVTYNASPTNYTRQWYPIRSGNLNGNNSQNVTVPTSGGKATVRYGWFPGNQIPYGFVMIKAALNNTPSINMTLYLTFNGTTQITWSVVPTREPSSKLPSSQTSDATPTLVQISDTTPPTQTSDATSSPTSTPLSPMVTLLSLVIGVAIVLTVRQK